MKYVKTPLRYPGGKSRAIDNIAPLVPINFKEYREPFIGGGSIYFYIRQKYTDKEFWINDLNYELYNFWKRSQEDSGEMIKVALQWKHQFEDRGKDLFKFLKSNLGIFKYNNDNIKLASAYLVLNQIVFSGCTLVGGFSESSFNNLTDDDIKELEEVGNILKGTKITNLDYQKVVEEKSKYNNDEVFVMLDPPYYAATESGLYGKSDKLRNLHKMFDHYRFADTMKKCKYKWLVTYDDSEFIRKLFNWATIIPWNLTYGMRQYDNVGKELFISNYLEKVSESKQANICDIW